jgi:hypothetical protein
MECSAFSVPQDLTFLMDAFYIEAMTGTEAAGFDPGGFYAFDLSRGAVQTKHGQRVLVVESDVVATLIATAAKHGDLTAVRALGKHVGEYAARSLGGDLTHATPEAVTTHAAGVLALLGWGALQLERWGDALVLKLEGAPALDSEQLGVSALLGGALTSLTGRDVACVPVSGGQCFIVVDPSIAEHVFQWTRAGQTIAQIVDKLAREGQA